jgi:[protein-PII] uridylyltransferase
MNVTLSSPRTAPLADERPAEKPLSGKHLAERTLPDRRAIVDRRTLVAALETIAAASRDATLERVAVLALLKETLAKGRAEIRRRFDGGGPDAPRSARFGTHRNEGAGDGRAVAHGTCFLVDQIIRAVYDHAAGHVFPLANPTSSEHMALVAVGGYGRGELAPQSDVDLLFLLPYKLTPHCEQVVEYLLYMLWDLGLKVGHATRSVDECIRQAGADMTIRTALLEARYLWGEQGLYDELRRRFQRDVVSGSAVAFVEAKLAERESRHARMGNTRYVLEPNIKDGKGGLRDLHTLFWIAKYVYQVDDVAALVERGVLTRKEVRNFEKASALLWSLRCQLHYLTGRPEERLTFDMQPDIAAHMGYTDHAGTRGVERLMKHYFLVAKSVGDLTRIFCAAIEAAHQRKPLLERLPGIGFLRKEIDGFPVESGRLTVAGDDAFSKDPVNILRLFHAAQRHGLDIHPAALKLVTRSLRLVDRKLRHDAEANRLFVDMLTSRQDPEQTLLRLNEAGVFGRFIPDFGRVVAQMQYDMYHHYTVDQHSIFAIGVLSRIEAGALKDEVPIASEVVHKVVSRRVLYLAVLLHDIAKGRGGDHSELGADVAMELGPRLGFTDEETETVAWLVRYHLIMSNTAFKRDVDDPQTIADFIGIVQSLERLRLLLVLTVADIRAVGPKTWNGWKAQLLRDLYYRAEEVLSGGLTSEGRDSRVAAALTALKVELNDWSDDEFEAHMKRGTPAYWLAFDTATHQRHARLVRDAEAAGDPLSIDTRVDTWRAVTEVTVYTHDEAGLFARLAGAMALSGADIVDARIFTLTNGMALDTFWIQDGEGKAVDRPDKLAKLAVIIRRVLNGRGDMLDEFMRLPPSIPSRLSVFKVPPRVLIDNGASISHTVIEVNGRDRKGLLYDLTHAFAELRLQISSAKVSTFGERAIDVFYVKDKYGLKIDDEARLKVIRTALRHALQEPADRGEAPPTEIPAETAAAETAAAE